MARTQNYRDSKSLWKDFWGILRWGVMLLIFTGLLFFSSKWFSFPIFQCVYIFLIVIYLLCLLAFNIGLSQCIKRARIFFHMREQWKIALSPEEVIIHCLNTRITTLAGKEGQRMIIRCIDMRISQLIEEETRNILLANTDNISTFPDNYSKGGFFNE